MPSIQLRILDARIGSQFPLPADATPGSAGVDLWALIGGPLVAAPGKT